MYSLILFDLDGTLVDPMGAITGGVAAALRHHGLPVPPDDVLRSMVGPPLHEGLASVAGVPASAIPAVAATYRAGYVEWGMKMSRPYPGVVSTVRHLIDDGATVAVATHKPEWLAERLLSVQGLRSLFASVHGSPRDEGAAPGGKGPIIGRSLDAHPVQANHAVMIGDRRQDVDGARENGLDCIGVSWGFAEPGELENAGAGIVVESAGELLDVLRNGI